MKGQVPTSYARTFECAGVDDIDNSFTSALIAGWQSPLTGGRFTQSRILDRVCAIRRSWIKGHGVTCIIYRDV